MSSKIDTLPWRLEWDAHLSVGIPELDAEHQHFIQLVNQLNEAIISRKGLDEINTCMRAIVQDATNHFEHEEKLLKACDYPDLSAHARIHGDLLHTLHVITERLEGGCTEYQLIEEGLNIKAALIEHLLYEDSKYRDYFQNNIPHTDS